MCQEDSLPARPAVLLSLRQDQDFLRPERFKFGQRLHLPKEHALEPSRFRQVPVTGRLELSLCRPEIRFQGKQEGSPSLPESLGRGAGPKFLSMLGMPLPQAAPEVTFSFGEAAARAKTPTTVVKAELLSSLAAAGTASLLWPLGEESSWPVARRPTELAGPCK